MKLNDLKRKHNALLLEGQEAYEKVLAMHKELLALQKAVKEIEGDDYDPIPLIFGGGYHIYPEEEGK